MFLICLDLLDVCARNGWRGRQSRGCRGGTRQKPKEVVDPPPSPPHPPRLAPCFSCSSSPSPAPTPGPREYHLSEEQSLPPGGWREQATLGPAHAGTRARAGWAAGGLAGRTWLALLCLQPLPPDSLINDLQRPGLCMGQQPHGCGSGQMDLRAVPPPLSAALPDGLKCFDMASSPGSSTLSADCFPASFKSCP